ncbi:MAG: TraR/DksA family transcriptional regulator [Myxococcaceae bacterium]
MTRTSDLRELRETLQKRRRDLLETSAGARQELAALKDQERDPEYEEGAQTELADYTLSHLVENHRQELMMIDAALTRMDQETFGECVDCGGEIAFERLQALPFALRCEEDATRHEQETRGGSYLAPSL